MPPISTGPKALRPSSSATCYWGSGIFIAPISAMPDAPIGIYPGREFTEASASAILLYADEVPDFVSHGVHRVVRFVAVDRPVARIFCVNLIARWRQPQHLSSTSGHAGRLRNPARVRARHREMMAVQMNWMIGHRQIGLCESAPARRCAHHRIDAGKPCCSRPRC